MLHHVLEPILAAALTTQSVVPDLWDEGVVALARMPIGISDVEARIDLIDGPKIEITYDLRGVGTVTLAVEHDESGSGLGLVLVGDETLAEFVFTDGIVDGKSVNLAHLAPQQAQAMAASMVQIWEREEVSRRVCAAALESRGLGCWIAGKVSGSVSGVLVAGSCQVAVPLPGVCELVGVEVYSKVSGYIEDKCDKAQNG